MFEFLKKKEFHQCSTEKWKKIWLSAVPEKCRNVPISYEGVTYTADIQVNHYVVMLQDGLLTDSDFFHIGHHFDKAGFHLVWIIRCSQDIEDKYLRLVKKIDGGEECVWNWVKPTMNFGRWISDQRRVTILLQIKPITEFPLSTCSEKILQKVRWAESTDPEKKVPQRTVFHTVASPASPAAMCKWLEGALLSELE